MIFEYMFTIWENCFFIKKHGNLHDGWKKERKRSKQNNNAYEAKIHLLYKKKLKFTFKKK